MKPNVFYSWQSDAPLDNCKHFIRDAIKQALKELKRDDDVFEPHRLDQDTKDVPGTPDVAATIYSKISSCSIFLSDLTLVGRAKEKKMPNANVAIELGYAAAEIGWLRLVSVINTASEFGTANELIFDLAHKRHPIEYSLDGQTIDREATFKKLVGDLKIRVKACFAESHLRAEQMLSRLDFQSYSFLSQYGHFPYFNLGPNEGVLQSQLIRLLDLELLRFDYSIEAQKYAYHWTYFGKLILERLGISVHG